MRTRSTSRTVGALVVLLALLLTACGGERVSEDPTQALQDAVRALGDYEGYDVTLRADVDESSVAAMREHGDWDEAEARFLTTASLRMQLLAEGATDPSTATAAYDLTLDGTPAVELRLTDGDFFVRAEAEPLLALAGDDEARAGFDEFVAEADQYGFGEPARALQGGDWMQLEGFEQLMSMYAGMGAGFLPDMAEAEELASEMGEVVRDFVGDLDVTYVGAEEPGEHVRAVADADAARDFLDAYFGVAMSGFAGAGAMSEAEMQQGIDEMLGEVPDDLEIPVEAWIAGGRLTRVGVDVVEVARANDGAADLPEGMSRFLVVADIAEFDGGIEAPADPLRVDLFELFGRAMGGAFGGASAQLGGEVEVESETFEVEELEELEELEDFEEFEDFEAPEIDGSSATESGSGTGTAVTPNDTATADVVRPATPQASPTP